MVKATLLTLSSLAAASFLLPAASQAGHLYHGFYPAPGHGAPNEVTVRHRPGRVTTECKGNKCTTRWRGPKTIVKTATERCVYKPWKGKTVCRERGYRPFYGHISGHIHGPNVGIWF